MPVIPELPILSDAAIITRATLKEFANTLQQLFEVPIAYVALLEAGPSVFTRIGSGSEYWDYLKTYPLAELFRGPVVLRESEQGLTEGAHFGNVRFAASAPLKTEDGLLIGFLVIADTAPRCGFSDADRLRLEELADSLTANMEHSMSASQYFCAQPSEAT